MLSSREFLKHHILHTNDRIEISYCELHQLAWEAEHEEELEEAHRSGREGFEGGDWVVNTLEYRLQSDLFLD